MSRGQSPGPDARDSTTDGEEASNGGGELSNGGDGPATDSEETSPGGDGPATDSEETSNGGDDPGAGDGAPPTGGADAPADRSSLDHDAIPASFLATIRIERTAPGTYRATQRDADVEGYGPTPHRAVAEFARRAETACFGDAATRAPDGRASSDPGR